MVNEYGRTIEEVEALNPYNGPQQPSQPATQPQTQPQSYPAGSAQAAAAQNAAYREAQASGVPVTGSYDRSLYDQRQAESRAQQQQERNAEQDLYARRAEQAARSRPGYYEQSTIGDRETQRRLLSGEDLGDILNSQLNRAILTPGTRDDQFFLNELGKWNRKPIEQASAYHAMGMAEGKPIPKNPYDPLSTAAIRLEKAPGGLQETGWSVARDTYQRMESESRGGIVAAKDTGTTVKSETRMAGYVNEVGGLQKPFVSVNRETIEPIGELPFIGIVPIISPAIAFFQPKTVRTFSYGETTVGEQSTVAAKMAGGDTFKYKLAPSVDKLDKAPWVASKGEIPIGEPVLVGERYAVGAPVITTSFNEETGMEETTTTQMMAQDVVQNVEKYDISKQQVAARPVFVAQTQGKSGYEEMESGASRYVQGFLPKNTLKMMETQQVMTEEMARHAPAVSFNQAIAGAEMVDVVKNPVRAGASTVIGFGAGAIAKGVEGAYIGSRAIAAEKIISSGGNWRRAEQISGFVMSRGPQALAGLYAVDVAGRSTEGFKNLDPVHVATRATPILSFETIPMTYGFVKSGAVIEAGQASNARYKQAFAEGATKGRVDYYVKDPVLKAYTEAKVTGVPKAQVAIQNTYYEGMSKYYDAKARPISPETSTLNLQTYRGAALDSEMVAQGAVGRAYPKQPPVKATPEINRPAVPEKMLVQPENEYAFIYQRGPGIRAQARASLNAEVPAEVQRPNAHLYDYPGIEADAYPIGERARFRDIIPPSTFGETKMPAGMITTTEPGSAGTGTRGGTGTGGSGTFTRVTGTKVVGGRTVTSLTREPSLKSLGSKTLGSSDIGTGTSKTKIGSRTDFRGQQGSMKPMSGTKQSAMLETKPADAVIPSSERITTMAMSSQAVAAPAAVSGVSRAFTITTQNNSRLTYSPPVGSPILFGTPRVIQVQEEDKNVESSVLQPDVINVKPGSSVLTKSLTESRGRFSISPAFGSALLFGTSKLARFQLQQDQGLGSVSGLGSDSSQIVSPFQSTIPRQTTGITQVTGQRQRLIQLTDTVYNPELTKYPVPNVPPLPPLPPTWTPGGGYVPGGRRKRSGAFVETFMVGLDMSIRRPSKAQAKSFTSPVHKKKTPKKAGGKKK